MAKKAVIIEPVPIETPDPKKGLTKMQVLRRQESNLTNAMPKAPVKPKKKSSSPTASPSSTWYFWC